MKAPTFCVQKLADVSRKTSPLFVHKRYRHRPINLKQNCVHTEQYNNSPGVHMALVVSFKKTLQLLKVMLIVAGNIETNPGPVYKLTPPNLYEELLELTDPVPFGKELGIPQLELDRIQRDHPEGKYKINTYKLKKYDISHRYEGTKIGSMSIYCQ